MRRETCALRANIGTPRWYSSAVPASPSRSAAVGSATNDSYAGVIRSATRGPRVNPAGFGRCLVMPEANAFGATHTRGVDRACG